MTSYRPVAYRPRRHLGQTFDEILGIPPAGGDLIRTAGHTVGAWFGIYIGSRHNVSTLLRIIGWVMGAGMAVAAALDLVSLAKRVAGTHPPEPRQQEVSA